MEKVLHKIGWKHRCGVLTAGALLCLSSVNLMAQESLLESATNQANPPVFTPFTLTRVPGADSLPFDLGGSDQRQLELRLSQPIGLQAFTNVSQLGNNTFLNETGTGLTLDLADGLTLGAGISAGQGQSSFQPVGSIHCQNGTLDAGSYRASNCYFVDGGNTVETSSLSLGAQYDIGNQASAAVSVFNTGTNVSNRYQAGNNLPSLGMDPFTMGVGVEDPAFSGFDPTMGMQELESAMTGVDLQFQVGVSTDNAGDMVVGLQLTHVLDSQTQGVNYSVPGAQDWTIAEPFETAKVSVDWYKGSFSGGVETYYRPSVDLVNGNQLDSYATFDVHFTWRAPWNASLSVGASNLLGAGSEEPANNEANLVDPFESIYGRIPYVRYKQDL